MKIAIGLLLVCVSFAKGHDLFSFDGQDGRFVSTFITNGLRANRQQFPYQAAIFLNLGNGQQGFCGGSLIAPEWVLTAAHCVVEMKSFTIILGAHRIANNSEEGRQVFNVTNDNAIVHKDWNMMKLRNDIALIRLPTKAVLTEYVQVVNLPKRSDDESLVKTGTFTTVSGWGRENDASKGIAEYLQYINQPVISNFKCAFYYLFLIRSGHMCTSGSSRMSTCQGDSGGPLVLQDFNRNDEVKQVGIVSFGIAFGCEKGWPPVFTRISQYLDFIEEATGLDLN